MKIPTFLSAVASCVFVASATAKVEPTPVERVLSLLQQLKAKIEDEGAAQQKVYDKYACWCDNTLKAKADAIVDAKNSIKKLQLTVLQMRGDSTVLAAEIQQLNDDIATNEQSQKQAASIRAKENESFLTEEAQLTEAIGALAQALDVLSINEGGKESAQVTKLIESLPGMRRAASLIANRNSLKLSETQKEALERFLQAPADFYGSTASFNSHYTQQSSTIVGILKQMHTEFTDNLANARTAEAAAVDAFDKLSASQRASAAAMKQSVEFKTVTKAEKEQRLADARAELENTQLVLSHDEKFFASSHDGCKAKADDWSERSRLRTEELEGMKRGIAFLSSDEARGLFLRTKTLSLAQIDNGMTAEHKKYASEVLSQIADLVNDPRVALISMKVGFAMDKEVFEAIDSMVALLKDEEAKDIKQKDWCFAETAGNTHKQEDREYDIKKLDTRLQDLSSAKAEIEASILQTNKTVEALDQQVAEAISQRHAQAAAFAKEKADDEAAMELLSKATYALGAYFDNNNIKMVTASSFILNYHHDKAASLVRHSADPMANKEPEFVRGLERAPDADFSEKDALKGASQSIIALLQHLNTNMANDLKLATQAEERAIKDHEAALTQAAEARQALEAKIADLQENLATNEHMTFAAQEAKTGNVAAKEAVIGYLKSIKPNCEFIGAQFTSRAEQRMTELEGLNRARAILKGAAGEAEYEAPAVVEVPTFLQARKLRVIRRV